ncbi:RlmE family RNA methyltransferase [Candidatus Cyrtobacter comes]|uniref:Ribosomal RNA large subunit methyltransferase E n=1 Tax=Candidatus Cyrtobacter comes TaxID=675776 RepID=A0ABU5L6S1_9RICK|nr:RlmE family RNA methyltransferase [Candidatus Cyrtobacter comes]MDZ5761820.1 RlmE family RNA methyltransferase [Candidatus Cyrtobacter comes]
MAKINKWVTRREKDPYIARSNVDGYRCRSAYKLLEINQKFHIFKKERRQIILDVGCAPGGWLQVLKSHSCSGSTIIGVDLKETKLEGVKIICGNFLSDEIRKSLCEASGGSKFDVALSDMATNSTGDAKIDQLRNFELVDSFIDFALLYLTQCGHLIAKIMCGEGDKTLLDKTRAHFREVKIYKPNSSYKDSAEKYLVAISKIK